MIRMKTKTWLKTLITGLTFSLLPFYLASCTPGQDDPLYNGRHPSYLLDPNNNIQVAPAGDNNDFDYYHIGTDKEENELYAVSLKDKTYASGYNQQTGEYETLVIPSEYKVNTKTQGIVTGIWRDAFRNCPATSITIPETITTIDYEAFLYSGITSITIPYTVSAIGEGAFFGCRALRTVTIQNSNATGGGIVSCACDGDGGGGSISSELTAIPSFCFFDCEALTSLTLPNSVEEIRYDAFRGCKALSSELYFEKINIIRARAFEGCASLSKLYFPQSFFDGGGIIEEHAFNYCKPSLEFYFCGAIDDSEGDAVTDPVEEWVEDHENWGWFNDTGTPAENSYSYIPVYGDIHYTDEWIYTVVDKGTHYDATIKEYRGSQEPKYMRIPDTLPYGTTQKKTYVRMIEKAAIYPLKKNLERIYLPTTLYAIDNNMFEGFSNLFVVDDNANPANLQDDCCENDRKTGATVKGRIDLSKMKDLEFIGTRAFPYMGGRNKVKTIHLPANLRAIGPEAFAIYRQSNRFTKVTKFEWDFDNSSSILEVVGNHAFYKIGDGGGTQLGELPEYRSDVTPTTIIFPRTFKCFGMSADDIAAYSQGKSAINNNVNCNMAFTFESISGNNGDGQNTARPGHAFASCPLIKKIIFKGSDTESLTTDLLIPINSFVSNDNLQAVIFEERNNHQIFFHTQNGTFGQPSVGSVGIGQNGGVNIKNDFRSKPTLQTIVLPNKTTNLVFQNYAFAGNARAAIYLTGKLDETIPNSSTKRIRGEASNEKFYEGGFNYVDIEKISKWRMIGDESYDNNKTAISGLTPNPGYFGYCFSSDVKVEESGLNSFGLSQQVPVYEDIYYEDSDYAHVKVGNSNSGKQLKLDGKYAFVCKTEANVTSANGVSFDGSAIMSNYLYDNDNLDNSEKISDTYYVKARVPSTAKIGSKTFKVSAIGDSAFSACFNDGVDRGGTIGGFYDLAVVELPDEVESIGEYAFMRAYGLRNVRRYSSDYSSPAETVTLGGDYEMPSSLTYIGRHAFAFCNVEQVLEIPDDCEFYETKYDTYNVAAAFTNDFSLKKITFAAADNNDNDPTSSTFYRTTTYSKAAVHFSILKDAGYDRSIYLVGSFNDWTLSEAAKMEWSTGNIWSADLDLFSGTYEYKYVMAPSTLTGNQEDEDWDTLNNFANRSIDTLEHNATFSVDYNAGVNYGMYFVGDHDWNLSVSTRMNLLGAQQWYMDLELPNGSFEYKYVKANYNNQSDSAWEIFGQSNLATDLSGNREFYTNALYSTSSATYNKSRLLLVLNRDSNAIGDRGLGQEVLYAGAVDSNTMLDDDSMLAGASFDGQYKFSNSDPSNAALYGAYKMGYWIYSLSVGPMAFMHMKSVKANATATLTYEAGSGKAVYIAYLPVSGGTLTKTKLTSGSNNSWSFKFSTAGDYAYYYFVAGSNSAESNPELIVVADDFGDESESKLPQPLFSGVVIRGLDEGNMVWSDYYIYLNTPIKKYDDTLSSTATACDLVSIAGNVTKMSPNALRGCENLAYLLLEYDEGAVLPNGLLASIDNKGLLFATPGNAQGTTIIAEEGTLNMRYTGYSKIGDEAFQNVASIERFTAPEVNGFTVGAHAFEFTDDAEEESELVEIDFQYVSGSLTIGEYAFKNSAVERFEAPNVGTLTLGVGAFQNCDSLTSIDFSKFTGNKLVIPDYCFDGCDNLETIKWPNNPDVTVEIGNFAFRNCISLTGNEGETNKLIFPKNTTKLGDTPNQDKGECFAGCESLVEIYLSPKLKTMGRAVFKNCTNLEKVDIRDDSVNSVLEYFPRYTFQGCSKLHDFAFPDFTFNNFDVYDGAFERTNTDSSVSRWNVVLPANYKGVGEKAFYRSGLGTLTVQGAGSDSFQFNKTNCFAECPYLTTITFASDLSVVFTSNPNNTFYNCPSLTTVTFPTSKDLTLPSSAFASCASLTTINFPTASNKKITLGQKCFMNCTSLTSVTFPTDSFAPAKSAFEGCTSLVGVYFSNPSCSWSDVDGSYMFKNCKALKELCLPTGFPQNSSKLSGFVTMEGSYTKVLHIFFHSSSLSLGSNKWYLYKSGISEDYLYTLANDYDDIIDNGLYDTNASFWKMQDGSPIALGNPIYGDANSVIFSNYDTHYVLFSDFVAHEYVVHHGIGDDWSDSAGLTPAHDNVPAGFDYQLSISIQLRANEEFGIHLKNGSYGGTWVSYSNMDATSKELFNINGSNAVAKAAGTYLIKLLITSDEGQYELRVTKTS